MTRKLNTRHQHKLQEGCHTLMHLDEYFENISCKKASLEEMTYQDLIIAKASVASLAKTINLLMAKYIEDVNG